MLNKKRILVIGKELSLIDKLKNQLHNLDQDILLISHSREKIVNYLKFNKIDLIIVDFDQTKHWKDLRFSCRIEDREYPIIFIIDQQTNKISNFCSYLPRSFGKDDLVNSIELAFNKFRIKRNLICPSNQFRIFIKEIDEGFGIVDENENFMFVNPAAEKIFGYSRQELLCMNIKDFIQREDWQKVISQTELRKQKSSSGYELSIKSKNGELKVIYVNAHPYLLDREFKGTFAIFRDVSYEQMEKMVLQVSESRLQRIFENIQDIYFELDEEGRIIQISPALEKYTHYRQRDVIGISMFDLFFNQIERDLFLQKITKKKKVTNYPITIFDKDGSQITCFISAKAIIEPEKDGFRLVGSLETTEDLKKHENKFKKIEEQYQVFINKSDIEKSLDQEKFDKFKDKLLYFYEDRKSRLIYRTQELLDSNKKLLTEISERKLIEEKLKEKSKSQNRLLKIAKYINSSLDTKEVLKRIAHEVMELLDSYGAAIYTYRKEKRQLIPQVVIDPDFKNEIAVTPLAIDSSFTGKAVIQKKCLIFNDAWNNEAGFQIPGTTEQKEERIISAPFIFDQEVIGALCLNRIGANFTEEERELVESFANYATIAIKNAKNYQKIQAEIKERISAEKALDESEKRFSTLWKNISVGIFRATPQGEFLAVNPAMIKMFGFNSEAEFNKMNAIELYVNSDDRKQLIKRLMQQGYVKNFEVQLQKKNSEIIWTSLNINKIVNDEGKWLYQDGIIADITDRKKNEKTQQVVNNIANAALEIHDLKMLYKKIHTELSTIIDAKNFYIAIYNQEKDIITAPYYQDQTKDHKPDPQPLGKGLTGLVIRSGKSYFIRKKERDDLIAKKLIPEYSWKAKIWIGVPLKKDNKVIGAMALQSYENEDAYTENDMKILEFVSGQIASTIARKEYEKALEESEKLNRAITDHSPIGITVRDNRGRLLKANKAWKLIWQKNTIEHDQFKEREKLQFDRHDNYLKDHFEKIREVYKKGGTYLIPELQVQAKRFSKPKWISHHFYAIEDKKGNVDKVVVLTDDISKKKETEQKFRKTQSRLSTIFTNVPNIILYELSKKGQFVSSNVRDLLGYSPDQFLRNDLNFSDIIHPQDKNIVDQKFNHWKQKSDKKLLNLWYRVKKKNGEYIWIEDRIVEIKDQRGESYIAGVKIDITDLKRSKEKLQQLLTETVNGLISAVEMRDPYTAGHQKRVASLALEVAKEMHLSKDIIDAIHIAALVHDIGKINIPSEILSKPGKLSKDEFEIIKMHPQTGYNILKKIDFPWPIAEIVLQHQERLDGSSYPNGLKGDEISIHARIISVADVIEAMSSHRPYRPAVGLQAALQEVTTNRGILYDAKVVDVCLKVFQEKNYKFPEYFNEDVSFN